MLRAIFLHGQLVTFYWCSWSLNVSITLSFSLQIYGSNKCKLLFTYMLLSSLYALVMFNYHLNLLYIYIYIILKVMEWKYMNSYQTLAQRNWGFHNLFNCLYSLQYGASDRWGARDLAPRSASEVIVDVTTISSIRGHLEWRGEISSSNNCFNFYVDFDF